MKHGLNVSLKMFMQVIEESMTAIVTKIQEHDFNNSEGKPLTIKEMVAEISADTGLPPQLLQLAASEVINESTTHYTLQGRYGGIRQGERPAPQLKKPSEKQILRQQIEDLQNELQNKLKKLESTPESESDTDPEASEKELIHQLDSVE